MLYAKIVVEIEICALDGEIINFCGSKYRTKYEVN